MLIIVQCKSCGKIATASYAQKIQERLGLTIPDVHYVGSVHPKYPTGFVWCSIDCIGRDRQGYPLKFFVDVAKRLRSQDWSLPEYLQQDLRAWTVEASA